MAVDLGDPATLDRVDYRRHRDGVVRDHRPTRRSPTVDIGNGGRSGAHASARSWWWTTRLPRRTCNCRWRSAPTSSFIPPRNTSAVTPTLSAARCCSTTTRSPRQMALPAERDRRGAGAVRLLVVAARPAHARDSCRAPAGERPRDRRRVSRRTPTWPRCSTPASAGWCRSCTPAAKTAPSTCATRTRLFIAGGEPRRGRIAHRASRRA